MLIVTDNKDLKDRLNTVNNIAVSHKDASKHSIRELHIGIANMMPGSALKATEIQFLKLIAKAPAFAKIVPHLIRVDGIDYGALQPYVDETYETLETVKEHGLDAMIVTGANIPNAELKNPPNNPFLEESEFYKALEQLIDYAQSDEGPTSTLYSCLASMAYIQIKHGQVRTKLDEKYWGNYEHWVTNIDHPFIKGISTKFNQPHSRWNEITWEQILDSDMKLLALTNDNAPLLATSKDGLRAVLLQGHPEYDRESLFKEWRRDLSESALKRAKEGNHIPLAPFPRDYFEGHALELAEQFVEKVASGELNEEIIQHGRLTMPSSLSKSILSQVHNTHSSVSNDIIGKWIEEVYKTTGLGLGEPFMADIDPDNPFNLPEDQTIYCPVYYDTPEQS